MKCPLFISIAFSTCLLLTYTARATGDDVGGQTQMHSTTEWRVEPSFKYDTLCFLNILTGDPFYVRFYQDEYDKFAPEITPEAEEALANIKRVIKDENEGIVSALLTLYFSATDDETIDDMLATVEDSETMRSNLMQTEYYYEESWQAYDSVRDDLKVVLEFLRDDLRFEEYWASEIKPILEKRIAEVETELGAYNIVPAVEEHLGFPIASNEITVYILYYVKPHGIRVTGMRYLSDQGYPAANYPMTAVHELMHPPYDWEGDEELRATMERFKEDAFVMDKVENHDPSFGYNTFEGYVEEDCVQSLDMIINEGFFPDYDARDRWKKNDDGMHVLAAALYSVMKRENYNERGEVFRDFLIRIVEEEKLVPGKVEEIYNAFYEGWTEPEE
jgi:hypothetical protein